MAPIQLPASEPPTYKSRSSAMVVVLAWLAASCSSGTSNEKLDAGQRRYCSAPDGGRDVSVSGAEAGDTSTTVIDMAAGDGPNNADGQGGIDAGRDSRIMLAEAGGLDASSVDLVTPDVRDAASDAPDAPIGADSSDTPAPDIATDRAPDSTLDIAADRGPDLAEAAPDTRPDSQPEVAPDAGVVLDANTPDHGPDGPAGTCSIGSSSWANAWPEGADLGNFSPGGLAAAPDGTRWASGSMTASADFGTGTPLLYTSQASALAAFLVKLNPSSGLVTEAFSFADQVGSMQTGGGVAVAENGNVGVIGVYVGEIDFTAKGSDSGDSGTDYLSKPSLSIGAPMGYYAIIDGTSSGQYVTPIKVHNVDLGSGAFQAMASNPHQNLIAVCGKTARAVTLYNSTNTTNAGLTTGAAGVFGGNTDIVVAVIDATAGTVVWGRELGGTGDQQCESVAMDDTGNVYIAGTYNGALDFGNDSSGNDHALPTVAPNVLGLMYVAKFGVNGVVQAVATWGSAGFSDVFGIAVDGSSNVVIAGAISATTSANFGAPVGTLTSRGKSDGFVVKLDPTLTALWGFTFGDAAYDQIVNAVAVSSVGDVVIGGKYIGALNGLNGLVSTGIAYFDAFTAELSGANGSILCAQSYGDSAGVQQITGVTVATAATGNLADSVVIGGNFQHMISVGSTVLNSSVTTCSADTDCYVPPASSVRCSNGYCEELKAVRSFVSRLSP